MKVALANRGYMVVIDLIWLTENPSQEAVAFWEGEYPDMQTIEQRLGQMRQAGFAVVDHFTLKEQACQIQTPSQISSEKLRFMNAT